MAQWPDYCVIAVYFGIVLYIGGHIAKKQKGTESYFMAGRNMPGWVVGFSLMATIISSMTFLAAPGFAFAEDWRYMPSHLGYLMALPVAIMLFMPFFRRIRVGSAYEYLEMRFGIWARLYAAGTFVLFQVFRMSVVLYAVSLAIVAMTDLPLPLVVLTFGAIAAIYTIAGGLEAVIWTDFIQSIALIVGGFICLPIIVYQLPGGMSQLFTVAYDQGKMSLGSTSFNLTEKTVWVMVLLSLFNFLQLGCVDQMVVQRYCAPRSRKEANKALWVGAAVSIPVWIYFTLIGTALFVFYQAFPDPEVGQMVPERVLPHFILSQLPVGVAGFVIAGLLAAAMSTVDSSINAAAATVTNDFYRRFSPEDVDERHYLRFGRWISVGFAVTMIAGSLVIHFTRTQTLADLQTLIMSIMSGGLLGLFLLGILSKKVDNTSAICGVVVTLMGVLVWIGLDSELGHRLFPALGKRLPDQFWIIVFGNISVFVLGYGLSVARGVKPLQTIAGLTIGDSAVDPSGGRSSTSSVE
jgi:solute:Na+ symporter, SSS family